MREEYKPGDLNIRLTFGQVIGTGPNVGQIRPTFEVSDMTSGLALEIDLNAADIATLLAGASVQVSAKQVSGFRGLTRWGKYLKVKTLTVEVERRDYQGEDPKELPHVAKAIKSLEADGYRCDTPRRNNSARWVIVGRRYDDQP